MSEAQHKINDFQKAAALTERLIQKFYDEELTFDAAMGGALTVMLQCILRSSVDSNHTLGILGSSLSIAVAANMDAEEPAPNEEILEAALIDEESLH